MVTGAMQFKPVKFVPASEPETVDEVEESHQESGKTHKMTYFKSLCLYKEG